jgi:hypothetical protein
VVQEGATFEGRSRMGQDIGVLAEPPKPELVV